MSPERASPVWQERLAGLGELLRETRQWCDGRLEAPDLDVNEFETMALLRDTLGAWLEFGLDTAQEHSHDPDPAPGAAAGEVMSALVTVHNWLEDWVDASGSDSGVGVVLAGVETLAIALMEVLDRSTTTNRDNPLLRSRLALLDARRAALLARRSAARADAVVEAVEAAAGVVSEGELAMRFSTYASDQGQRAAWWLAATVLLLGVAGVTGVVLLQGASQREWSEVVAHVLIAAPAAGLAAYAARESSRRREEAARARLLQTQLQTINAYRAQLSAEHSEELVMQFGRYLYGPYSRPGDNPLHAVPPGVLDAVLQALKR